MDINLLKYLAFVKTVEYGSFTRAADVLHYSQSGVSRMIRDLESEWDITLLERSRAGVAPDSCRWPRACATSTAAFRRRWTTSMTSSRASSASAYSPAWPPTGSPTSSAPFNRTIPASTTSCCWETTPRSRRGLHRAAWTAASSVSPPSPPSRLSLWRRTACWPSCRRATRWRRWNGSPCPPCVRSRSSCWKRAPVRRYRISSSAAA